MTDGDRLLETLLIVFTNNYDGMQLTTQIAKKILTPDRKGGGKWRGNG